MPQPVPGVSIDDARAKLQELNKAKGYAVCQAVMKALQMPRVSELKPEQIKPFIDAVQAEINKP